MEKKTDQGKLWHQYIIEIYKSPKKFVDENKLEMYFENNQVISFWGTTKKTSWQNASSEEWATYFETASKCIDTRNGLLYEK